MTGTPKTLLEAIINGVNDATDCENDVSEEMAIIIKSHVRDFLAQKFTIEIMDTKAGKELWNRITGESR